MRDRDKRQLAWFGVLAPVGIGSLLLWEIANRPGRGWSATLEANIHLLGMMFLPAMLVGIYYLKRWYDEHPSRSCK